MQGYSRRFAVAFNCCLHRIGVAASIAFLCTFWVASAYAQTPAESPKSASKSVHVYSLAFTPLKRHGGPVVRVRLNDKIDASFLIDTGSPITVITANLAKKLNLSLKRYINPNKNSFPAGTKLDYGVIENLNIGGSEGEAAVLVSDTVLQVADDKTVEGILGMSDLATYALIFNFNQNQLLVIEDGNLNDVLLNTFGAKGGFASGVPIHSTDDRLKISFTIPAFVDGKKYDLYVDSGAPITTLPALEPKIKTRLKPKSTLYRLQAVSGVATYTAYPLPTFSVGNTASNSLSPFQCGTASGAREAQANLGMNYLSHFQVILDCPAQRMYLTPVNNPANPLFPTEASRESAVLKTDDLILMPTADGKWAVVSIESKGYYGKAGIQATDIVEKVNAETVAGKLSCEIGALFDKDDKVTKMQILRNGKSLGVTVHIK